MLDAHYEAVKDTAAEIAVRTKSKSIHRCRNLRACTDRAFTKMVLHAVVVGRSDMFEFHMMHPSDGSIMTAAFCRHAFIPVPESAAVAVWMVPNTHSEFDRDKPDYYIEANDLAAIKLLYTVRGSLIFYEDEICWP